MKMTLEISRKSCRDKNSINEKKSVGIVLVVFVNFLVLSYLFLGRSVI